MVSGAFVFFEVLRVVVSLTLLFSSAVFLSVTRPSLGVEDEVHQKTAAVKFGDGMARNGFQQSELSCSCSWLCCPGSDYALGQLRRCPMRDCEAEKAQEGSSTDHDQTPVHA